MADKKISQLTALSAANVASATDVLAIVDTSATETKKITAKDLIDGALNGGTANGVLYLNGSKVATSGTALVFDGTNLGIGTSSPSQKLDIITDSNAFVGQRIRNNDTGSSAYAGLILNPNGNSWGIRSGSSAANGNALNFTVDILGTPSNLLTLTSSGNLGLGVTPSLWVTLKPLEIAGAGNAISGFPSDAGIYVTSNAYYGTSGWRYGQSAKATTRYSGEAGVHSWSTASGVGKVAGDLISFTQAMTLDASSNLGIGTTSPGARLSVTNSNATSPTAEFGGNQVREFVRTGTQSSDGTIRVDIAFTSQGSNWSSQLIEIAVSTSAGGSSSRYGGVVRYVLTSLTDLQGPTALASDLTGLTVATAFSGMEFRVTFSTTGGNIDLYCVHVRVLSSNTSAPATSVVIS